jgi:hypothetical protein
MPAALRVTLTTEENQTLQELEVASQVPRRTGSPVEVMI